MNVSGGMVEGGSVSFGNAIPRLIHFDKQFLVTRVSLGVLFVVLPSASKMFTFRLYPDLLTD